MLQGWACHKASHGITSKDMQAYAKAYDLYLNSKHRTQFKTWLLYDKAKVLFHQLSNLGILEKFKTCLNCHTDFLHPELNPERSLHTMHEVISTIVNNFEHFMPPAVLAIVLLEAAKFVACSLDILGISLGGSTFSSFRS